MPIYILLPLAAFFMFVLVILVYKTHSMHKKLVKNEQLIKEAQQELWKRRVDGKG